MLHGSVGQGVNACLRIGDKRRLEVSETALQPSKVLWDWKGHGGLTKILVCLLKIKVTIWETCSLKTILGPGLLAVLGYKGKFWLGLLLYQHQFGRCMEIHWLYNYSLGSWTGACRFRCFRLANATAWPSTYMASGMRPRHGGKLHEGFGREEILWWHCER